MRVRRTLKADRDIDGILDETFRLFGERQLEAYADLIDGTIEQLAEQTTRLVSRARPDVGPGVRSLRVGGSRLGRRAAHQLFFVVREGRGRYGPDEVIVLRVLHVRMLARHRVTAALGELKRS